MSPVERCLERQDQKSCQKACSEVGAAFGERDLDRVMTLLGACEVIGQPVGGAPSKGEVAALARCLDQNGEAACERACPLAEHYEAAGNGSFARAFGKACAKLPGESFLLECHETKDEASCRKACGDVGRAFGERDIDRVMALLGACEVIGEPVGGAPSRGEVQALASCLDAGNAAACERACPLAEHYEAAGNGSFARAFGEACN